MSIVVLWAFINAYLEAPIFIGGLEIPAGIAVLSLPFMLVIAGQKIGRRDAYTFIALIFLAALTAFFAPNWSDLGSRLRGLVQISFSWLCFILIYKSGISLSHKRSGSLFFRLVIALVLLTALERFAGLKQLSDSFREAVYIGSYTVYDGDSRDLNMVGFIRPKLFTSEPSLLGLGFAVASFCALLASTSKQNRIILFTLTLLQWGITGTPISLLGLAAYLIQQAKNRFSYGKNVATFGIAFIVLVASLSAIILSSNIGNRFDLANLNLSEAGSDKANESSERLRLVYPYVSALDAIKANPIFGLGIGGKRSLEHYSSFTWDYAIAIGNNAFASIFVFFGLLGSFALFWILKIFLERHKADLFAIFIGSFAIMHAMGALESPRCWMYLGLIAYAGTISNNRRSAIEEHQSVSTKRMPNPQLFNEKSSL